MLDSFIVIIDFYGGKFINCVAFWKDIEWV